jgi:hypothetical protein
MMMQLIGMKPLILLMSIASQWYCDADSVVAVLDIDDDHHYKHL